jgi:dihydrodipicolinate synthase/N-acetylneuraminate lyase
MTILELRAALAAGHVIPAQPLALTAERKMNEARQRGLTRYYKESGAGGIAVGVHTTQFAIRVCGLGEPVLRMAREEWPEDRLAIAGICGPTLQARREAELAGKLGYHAGLLSLAALAKASDAELLAHAREVSQTLPILGFYLQPSVGGRVLSYDFWRRFMDIENVVAVKIAPFHRYRTIDVVRALAASGRGGEISLYTGNDDNIINDLLTEYEFNGVRLRFAGGLLGQWAVWTRKAVEILEDIKTLRSKDAPVLQELLTLNAQLTDANAAVFDVANDFAGCIAGVHEVLRRQGLLDGIWCLDEHEDLGPGQAAELDRVMAAYPQLQD